MEIKNENPEEVIPEIVIPVDEEKALDDSINDIISKAKQAEHVEDTTTPTVEVKTDTPPAEVVVPKEETPTEPAPESIDFTKAPTKGKFESDESYTMRVNLFDLINQRKTAKTQGEKDAIQEQMKALRTEISDLSRKSKPSLLNFNNDDTPQYVKPEEGTQPLTPEQIDAIVDQKLQQRQQVIENKSVIDSFFDKHAEFKDPDVKDVFIEFFDNNYKIDGKSPKEVTVVLDLARQAMFRPSETVQERVLKAAGVQEKVNVMQFPGGTIVKPGLTAEQQKSIDEIVATGMSEQKARELILD